MYIEIYELIGLLFTAFSTGFALAKYLNKTITEKRISCHIIEDKPRDIDSRFTENSKIILFYQNTQAKTLICKFQKKTFFLPPKCKLTNDKCVFF